MSPGIAGSMESRYVQSNVYLSNCRNTASIMLFCLLPQVRPKRPVRRTIMARLLECAPLTDVVCVTV